MDNSAVIDNIVGRKVIILRTAIPWCSEWAEKEYTIADVGFRIGIDGKCFSVVLLEGLGDKKFILKDLKFV